MKIDSAKHFDLTLDFETRTTALVNQMSIEEKISQLGNNSPAIPRLGVLEYNWWNECLHGVARAGTATVFPQAIGMAATFNPSLINEVAVVISDEARAKHHEAIRNKDYSQYKGLTFWSPNINIFRDPRWGRGHETYGEDPYLTGQIGTQFVKGLQGNDSKYMKLIATAKHFAVHSGPESERHFFNVNVNQRDLWETYLPAFKDLIVEAKAYSIMGAYNRVNGESASASKYLLQDILREKWGFEGYVVSDCGAIYDIHANHKIVKTSAESAALGVLNGCDLNCGSIYQKNLNNSVELGLINENEIDTAVYRLFLARMKLGMFDPPEIVSYAQIPFDINNSEKHDQLSLKTD
jgi:beta-glucosidase